MKFPDELTRLRPAGADEYGNPASSWDAPSSVPVRAFVITGAGVTPQGNAQSASKKALMPPGVDVKRGDRLQFGTETYDVVDARDVRSPSRTIMVQALLRRADA